MKIENFSVFPIISYSNVFKNKYLIYKDNKNKSGIYRWNNLASYIGRAIDLTRKLRDYFSLKKLKREIFTNNSKIYKAILNYGYSNFSLEILEYCDKRFVNDREKYYINLLKPEYTICLKANFRLGYKIRKETLLKLRKVWLNRLFLKSKENTLIEFFIDSTYRKL